MYSSQRSPSESRRPEYAPLNNGTSTTQTPAHAFSPDNRPRVSSMSGTIPPSPKYDRSHPSSPSAPRLPSLPPLHHMPARPYEPAQSYHEGHPDYGRSQYLPRSPIQSRAHHSPVERLIDSSNHLPEQRAHQGSPLPYAPPTTTVHARADSSGTPAKPSSTTRTTNVMSVLNMLSDTTPPPPPEVAPAPAPPPAPVPAPATISAPAPPPISAPLPPSPSPEAVRNPIKTLDTHQPSIKAEEPPATPMQEHAQSNGYHSQKRSSKPDRQPTSVSQPPTYASLPSGGPPGLSVRGTEEEYARIEAQELSDVEQPGFEGVHAEWKERSRKRYIEIEMKENSKRKRRRTAAITKYHDMFATSADAARDIFIATHEKEAEEEVRSRDVEDEKERKKDMQRKRRRERTLQNEMLKRDEALERLQDMEDEEERSKVLKDVARAGKKIKNTEDLLHGRAPSKDIRGESPFAKATNLEGGTMSSFQASDDMGPESSSKTKKSMKGYRPRKSKEQKLAEKENAIAAQAFIDRGDELPAIAPKEEARLRELRRESTSDIVDTGPSDAPAYSSKGYNQIYEQIWKDLAKNHINKVVRIKNASLDTKTSNLRKTAQLASKEARRWQLRTNKSTKDVQARAKRSMREMLSFWKRNERDERDQRKMAEKQELENARKAEADREANRQKRKLNFLISQTELYSHFIGKKVKTDELEKAGDDVTPSGQTMRSGPPDANTVDLPGSVAKLGTKVTNFEELDFDNDDETALQEAAMANAQNAIQEAQDRARAFNTDGQLQSQFDDGEMNFQNPTSLQTMDVEQPKMLNCQLKEYQLKGLNWLVNLYEQGINGILADEMGLGKTVQSISVMAYLAEVHNIWGPFLVIAPASTLHNWQQEITRFVPNIKVLPYWGNAKDRKVLRKFWDRKHITYTKDSSFHVLVTSYQLVVQDTAYFQKVRWQYMILDEAQAIKSSQSSRWKALLGFHCRNRLLLTGTPIQNNMQELWALLHFIMPSLFDSHDEFSDWFSKDIESHAQSNTKLNEDQLKRLHMILKPFMLRRVKKHVQKELGDKIEEDVFCDLTYRQRAYYTNLRNKISIMDLIEKAAVGDDQDTATLMNLVMQFRKVCNHPDLFERAEITSPMSMSTWAETASFMREGYNINVSYSVRNLIEYWLPRRIGSGGGRLDLAGPDNVKAGWRNKYLNHMMSVWDTQHIRDGENGHGGFSWLRFVDESAGSVSRKARKSLAERAIDLAADRSRKSPMLIRDEENEAPVSGRSMLHIVSRRQRSPLGSISEGSHLHNLLNVSRTAMYIQGYGNIEPCAVPAASAPPIELVVHSQQTLLEKETTLFNIPVRRALGPISETTELALLRSQVPPSHFPVTDLLPTPSSEKQRYTKIQVPSMRRFVTDSGKLAQLDRLLKQLKEGNHRVLLYFQMTRMIDLMEEYLTYRNYKYCRLDGSTKLEDRRDTVAAFQSSNEIFVFLLSTRAGGLGINLTAADTVIFYDSDWNPTIDSQAMDRAHRLGQTRQVTVYRLITRGTIEERIRKRALQKEEVQRVVISGGAPAGGDKTVDFNARSTRENRTKDIALWLADDEQAAAIEKKEAELAEQEAKDPSLKGKKRKAGPTGGRKKEVSMDDMYHEGEGKFDDDNSNKPSGAATPIPGSGAAAAGATDGSPAKKKKGMSKKAKTVAQRLAVADGGV